MGCNTSKDGHGVSIKKPAPVEGRTHCGPWIKTPEDIVDFPLFPEGHQQSLVCKYLTKEIWEEYKDKKDAAGVSFKQCIISAV